MEQLNEIDALFDLINLWRQRLNVEKNDEKYKMIKEILEDLEEAMELIDNYLYDKDIERKILEDLKEVMELMDNYLYDKDIERKILEDLKEAMELIDNYLNLK